jgi:hypothetical protein
MSYVLLFFAAFFMVGLLGLQSKNVQHSRYLAAAMTSMGISLSNYIFVKFVAVGGLDTLLIVMVGGASGIITAIYAHDHHLMKRRKK